MRHPDIRSPLGQAHERLTELGWQAILKHYSSFLGSVRRQELHDTHPADGIMRYDNGDAFALIEIKSRRDFDEKMFFDRHRGEWLISNHKITRNVPIAKKLGVPFIGAMNIVDSRVVYLKTIWENGKLCDHTVRNCETRANINGGKKSIDNAFIPMHKATRVEY